MNKHEKQRRKAISEEFWDKLDEVRAYSKAHSPEEKNGQSFKEQMATYRRELEALRMKRFQSNNVIQ